MSVLFLKTDEVSTGRNSPTNACHMTLTAHHFLALQCPFALFHLHAYLLTGGHSGVKHRSKYSKDENISCNPTGVTDQCRQVGNTDRKDSPFHRLRNTTTQKGTLGSQKRGMTEKGAIYLLLFKLLSINILLKKTQT